MESFIGFWSSTFISQFLSRILSFASNQILVRLLEPELFGIWSVRLSLINETIIFWARDGVRKASAKAGKEEATYYRYSLLPLVIGFLISPVILFLSLRAAPEIDGYMVAVFMTVLGSLLELVGEIWAVPQLAQLQPKPTSRVTAISFLLKSVITVILTKTLYTSPYELMLIFGFAHLLYGVLTVVLFFIICKKPYIEYPTKREIRSLRPFAFQTILQWLFSQGERMILLMITTPAQIGVYGLVSDLCALVARIIFAPIEMSVYSLCASQKNAPVDVISILTRVVLYVALFAASFGPQLGPPLLSIVYGQKWSTQESKDVLSAFCRVMPFIALNGISEAFPNARLPQNRLEIYNIFLAVVNASYLLMTYLFGKLNGPVGAIYSNGVAMSVRSAMALYVIFSECGPLWSVFPNPALLLAFGCISVLGSRLGLKICAALLPVFGATVLFLERNTIKYVFDLFKPKRG
ncbi:nuclear division RFT1-like protein [Tritrichomonas foetus]|uniref:Protein RFT1 homolog n=1 Tax=Tritrichomonas foetus TaxID=1144522 RepID=A0A1J4JA05_9EUKA|nr:nuclear division RFT1-like protein [Tritrichomonas foetus]|eukprot:OHS94475.1 nuclear division RFT1-like protein [Tritrichomonas foetus]